MICGTGSGVGKSLLTTACVAWLSRQGVKVAPFKAQNMSLNAAVTPDGGEVGRSTAVQAWAAGVPLSTDMNPVLIKPHDQAQSQVIVNGRPFAMRGHAAYYDDFPVLREQVLAAFARLAETFDVVVMEGAGSPAEFNLWERDLVNLPLAEAVDAPVLLVGDIEQGGVFASLLGTLDILPDHWRQRIIGLLINRFRGDASLVEPCFGEFAARTGKPVLGLLPWLDQLLIDEEDALAGFINPPATDPQPLLVGVVRLPRMSNFTDFSTLAQESDVELVFYDRPGMTRGFDVIVLPGSKNVPGDLAWLRRSGFDRAVTEAVAGGRTVVGMCGGYQLLQQEISDAENRYKGLGFLPLATSMGSEKRTMCREVAGTGLLAGFVAEGYEIHHGRTTARQGDTELEALFAGDPLLGVRSGRILGTYLHGLFDRQPIRRRLIDVMRGWAGLPANNGREEASYNTDTQRDRLADWWNDYVDHDRIRRDLSWWPKA